MLTQQDFDEIEQLVKDTVKEEIKSLPTKDDFFTKMDEVVKELQAIREENPVMKEQISRNTKRIEKIESHLNLAS